MQRATALSPSKHFNVKSLSPIHIPASLYIYLDRILCKMGFPEKNSFPRSAYAERGTRDRLIRRERKATC